MLPLDKILKLFPGKGQPSSTRDPTHPLKTKRGEVLSGARTPLPAVCVVFCLRLWISHSRGQKKKVRPTAHGTHGRTTASSLGLLPERRIAADLRALRIA